LTKKQNNSFYYSWGVENHVLIPQTFMFFIYNPWFLEFYVLVLNFICFTFYSLEFNRKETWWKVKEKRRWSVGHIKKKKTKFVSMGSSFAKRGGFLTFFSLKKFISVKKEFLFSLNMFFFSLINLGVSLRLWILLLLLLLRFLRSLLSLFR
jgi:hypothetical protein